MRVTIVTPSYNQAAYLEETILSVVGQDYPDLEYFVVDGASTDKSREIISRHADSLTKWVSEPDKGQAEAINKGMAWSTGEIVAWINSDDYYLPGAIRSAVEELEADPECGMVYGNVLAVDAIGRPVNLIRYGQYGVEDLMEFQIIGQPAVFMRRWAYEKVGGLNADYHFMLDHHLWLRIANNYRITYIDQTWAAARFHPFAKNLAQAQHFGLEAFRIRDWMQASPTFREGYLKRKNKIQAGADRLNGWYCSEGGSHRQALLAYWRCFQEYPGTAMKDWKRILYSLAATAGINLKPAYQAMKKQE